jgi:hypothetical protein
MVKNSNGSTATWAEFAKRRGVSEMTITRWKRRGLIVTAADGKIDVAASEKLLDARPAVYRGGAIGGSKSKDRLENPESLARSLAIKEEYNARRAKLAYEREAGRLFDVEAGAKMIAGALAVSRNAWLGLGTELAPQLTLCKTAAEMKAVVDAAVARKLEDLSNYAGPFDEENEGYDPREAEHYRNRLGRLS